jgi:hypothetical protein
MTGDQSLQKDLAEALGISPAQVTRDKARGMPVHLGVDACREWRRENVRARVVAVAPKRPGQPPEGAVAAGAARVAPEASGDDYWTSRARREAAEAAIAEVKLQELAGDLVRRADVRARHAQRLAAAREGLQQIPARLAPVLAAETDQARCHDLLQAELDAVLQGLHD